MKMLNTSKTYSCCCLLGNSSLTLTLSTCVRFHSVSLWNVPSHTVLPMTFPAMKDVEVGMLKQLLTDYNRCLDRIMCVPSTWYCLTNCPWQYSYVHHPIVCKNVQSEISMVSAARHYIFYFHWNRLTCKRRKVCVGEVHGYILANLGKAWFLVQW